MSVSSDSETELILLGLILVGLVGLLLQTLADVVAVSNPLGRRIT
jgi:hypothetical protein